MHLKCKKFDFSGNLQPHFYHDLVSLTEELGFCSMGTEISVHDQVMGYTLQTNHEKDFIDKGRMINA